MKLSHSYIILKAKDDDHIKICVLNHQCLPRIFRMKQEVHPLTRTQHTFLSKSISIQEANESLKQANQQSHLQNSRATLIIGNLK